MLYNSFFPLLFAPLLAASEIPFKEYILAPPSRIIRPSIIYGTNGTVSGALPGTLTLGAKSSITYDFGKNIAGWVTLVVEDARNASSINVTFSESSLWISSEHCDATADAGFDEPLVFEIDGEGEYSAPWERERGAFRYMSIVASEEVVLGDAWVYFTAMPHWGDDALQDYTGWFHCDDNQLNRIWYAGAYTNQLDTIDPLRGDALIFFQKITHTSIVNGTLPWYNNFTITNGSSALTDGAKRDRLVWAGDMAIAVPGLAVSTFDLVSVANSLDSLFALQLENGMLPYAGTPFNEAGAISFTYHLYTLIGIADYYHWSGNLTYLQTYWPAWKDAMSWSVGHVDSSGLANITSPSDWLRFGMGGYNIEANSILYFTLNLGISLASTLNDTTVAEAYSTYMTGIKSAANSILWDDKASLYKDNETDTTLHPQDGNVWAIKSGIIPTPSRANEISAALRERWTPYGAPAPEAADAISPFISGFELEAHFMANETQNGLDLMRMMWGDFMLDDPRMTNSTFIEGYSTTGELHYAPYTNDARISHAHGWATGPTSTMTIFIAGIKLTSEAGRTWSITPQTGDLKYAEAGFSTTLGLFSSSWRFGKKDSLSLNISTPEGTTGDVGIPTGGKDGIVEVRGRGMKFRMKYKSDEYDRFWIQDLEGGDYEINVWRK